jgi:protein transport protein SEC24
MCQLLIPCIYPVFYSLHKMFLEVWALLGLMIIMLNSQPEWHGLFMIEDGQNIFLWIECNAVPQLIINVFDLLGYEVLCGNKVGHPSFMTLLMYSHH